jgi:hypothetical protein
VIFSQLDQYDVAQAEGGDMGRFDEVSHHPVARPVRGIVMRKLLWLEERDVGRVGGGLEQSCDGSLLLLC